MKTNLSQFNFEHLVYTEVMHLNLFLDYNPKPKHAT